MLALARRAAERSEGLREEKIASEKEWLQARQDREAAEIRLQGAREKLVRLGLTRGEVEALAGAGGAAGRGRLVLRAPAAGVVLEMHAVPGELVRPDQSILTVGDLSDLWLWADLYEDQLGRVLAAERSALRAGVTVKAFPGEVFPGTVDFVGPTMDEKTRTVKVRIAVGEPRRRAARRDVRRGAALPAGRRGGAGPAALARCWPTRGGPSSSSTSRATTSCGARSRPAAPASTGWR